LGLLGAWRISIRALDQAPPRAALGSGSDGAFAFRVTATFHIKDVPTEAAVRQDAASGVTETTYTDEFGFVDGQIAVEFG
jgi:hypothetical protein